MSGLATAVFNGQALVRSVIDVCSSLGLETREQFRMGARLWGAARFVDVLVTDPRTRKRLGIECKFQGSSGSAEEKIVATLDDIGTWPIQGIVVLGGDGFSAQMRAHLLGSGRAVNVEDLGVWLCLFFCLELP